MKHTAYDVEGRRKYLNRKENHKFCAAVESLSPERAGFCLTIYFTGCRISEALALSVDDVEWESEVIRFKTLKQREKKVSRRIPIPNKLTGQLAEIVKDRGDGKIWNFSRTTAWRIVKKAMREAKIEGIQATAKGLRHGFGVRGAVKAIPINVLRNWMGHADIATTIIYLDIIDDEELEMIRRTWKA